MKKERTFGAYLTCCGAIIAVIAAILYRNVMYKYTPVYYFLIGAIVLSVVGFFLATIIPVAAGLIPVINAALMARAAVWAASLMVNQIGYVVAGLDGIDTIMAFIIFATVAVLGMIIYIISACMPVAVIKE